MKVAILGGGLAGCALGYVLKREGFDPVIYEAADVLASAASGNAIGLYNPRFGAEWSPQSQYYAGAFERALAVFETLEDIDFNPCGALHFVTDEKKERRFGKMAKSWRGVEMDFVDAAEASEIAGIAIEGDALYLPQSGSVSPPKLCAAYVDGVEIHFNHNGQDIDADITVLAAGTALRNFEAAKDIDLRAVRGQVTMIKEAASLTTNLCYGGYVSTGIDGVQMIGSTFQRWLDHSEVLEEDDADNIEKLHAALPAFPHNIEIVSSRASVRTTSKDHFPVVGQLDEGLYISSAHGSHGILSSLMAAEIIAAQIAGEPLPVPNDVISALSPHRFKD